VLVLALDTTTRSGSLALVNDGRLVGAAQGDPSRTHAERLPGDLLALLDRHHFSIGDVDVYGVAAGPGAFTGLRVGIATIQGLAFANCRRVVAVSALEARAYADLFPHPPLPTPHPPLLGVWMDAHRSEVFSALYRVDRDAADVRLTTLEDAAVDQPDRTLVRWRTLIDRPIRLVGDGALVYRTAIERTLSAEIGADVPPIAPSIAALTAARAHASILPHALQPIYVRRPDAELARARNPSHHTPAAQRSGRDTP
jgi:tRNA threonylcarbamoyladenosine biosynthesis protein TsaB